MTIEGLAINPSELVVRAFDGSRRTIIGEVDLPIKISPHTFFISFFVVDIYLAYSYLLGRPWIHSEGEEDIMVSHLPSFRYVEGGGEVKEIPFQSFEIFNVEMVGPIGEVKTAEFLMPP